MVRTAVRLPDEVYTQLSDLSHSKRVSLNSLIVGGCSLLMACSQSQRERLLSGEPPEVVFGRGDNAPAG